MVGGENDYPVTGRLGENPAWIPMPIWEQIIPGLEGPSWKIVHPTTWSHQRVLGRVQPGMPGHSQSVAWRPVAGLGNDAHLGP